VPYTVVNTYLSFNVFIFIHCLNVLLSISVLIASLYHTISQRILSKGMLNYSVMENQPTSYKQIS
jgi:hypothetical protein